MLRRDSRELLASAQNRCGSLIDELSALRSQHHGADWVHKRSQELLIQGGLIPSYVVTKISDMVRTRNATIYADRLATAEEAERAVVMTERVDRAERKQGPAYVAEEVGTLDGLSALFDENNLKKLLIEDLMPGLDDVRSLDVDQLTDAELARWVRWTSELDGKVEKVRTTVSAGRRLLTPRNINQLTRLARGNVDQRALSAFVRSLDDKDATATKPH